ncbi:SIS domain-containing protein [Paludibaculum fermentans]|uniref:SIS domain-containing protein n=1 Tax=Paludibaculum fermentans TaxID=1473598 RepID=UPI003EB83A85
MNLATRSGSDTQREIWQQPSIWRNTAERVMASSGRLKELLDGCGAVVLTGSGSSQFAGECVDAALEEQLGHPVRTVGGGALLTHGALALPPLRPLLLVSLARSGDSPESAGAVELLLREEQHVRHLILTCNREGRLARLLRQEPRAGVVVLDKRTNDRSLVMTSSFTNLVLAARALGWLADPAGFHAMAAALSRAGSSILENAEQLKLVAAWRSRRAVFLGSHCRFGAAREAALKTLEMTNGRVMTAADTFLGLRHGPMCAIDERTLVVCFLSNDATARAYECDLIQELNRKHLGRKLLVGTRVPAGLAAEGDAVFETGEAGAVNDNDAPVLDALVGQLLGYFRCLEEGLWPDAPSKDGVINRVVENFRLHTKVEDGEW